jgi:hypothetical protein
MIACDNPDCLKEWFHMKYKMKNAPRKYFQFWAYLMKVIQETRRAH